MNNSPANVKQSHQLRQLDRSRSENLPRPPLIQSILPKLLLPVIFLSLAACSDQQGASISNAADSEFSDATNNDSSNSENTNADSSANDQTGPETTSPPAPGDAPPNQDAQTSADSDDNGNDQTDPTTNQQSGEPENELTPDVLATQPADPDPDPVEDNAAQPQPAPQTGPEPVIGRFELSASANTNQLNEGNTDGIQVNISINRRDGHQSPVTLKLYERDSEQLQSLNVEFTDSILPRENNNTTARVVLPIAAGPILPHRRTVVLEATDGQNIIESAFELSVRPIDAVDVYLLAGQSNMTGASQYGSRFGNAGEPDEVDSRIDQLNVQLNSQELFDTAEKFTSESFNILDPVFHIAEDPLHNPRYPGRVTKDGNRIGPGLTFAKSMLPYTTQKIILVPSAWDATSFCRSSNLLLGWNAQPIDDRQFGNTLLLDRAIMRLNVALRESGGIFRGIVWHQGESDSNDRACAERYEDNLVSLIQAVRSRAREDRRGAAARGPDAFIPFVAGTMLRREGETDPYLIWSDDKFRVDAAHRNIGNRVPYAGTALADDLVPPAYPCGSGSCIHFGASAQRELGFRYHEVIQNILRSNRR